MCLSQQRIRYITIIIIIISLP